MWQAVVMVGAVRKHKPGFGEKMGKAHQNYCICLPVTLKILADEVSEQMMY